MDSFGDAFDNIPVPIEGGAANLQTIGTEFTDLTNVPPQTDLLANVVHELDLPVFNDNIPNNVVIVPATEYNDTPVNIHIPESTEDQAMNSSELINQIDEMEKEKEEKPSSGERVLAAINGFSNFQPGTQKMNFDTKNVRVTIIEQPAPNKLRFRYAVEGRGAGAVVGEHTTADNKTFPTIKIEGYEGQVAVVVSCVEDTPDPAYPGRYRVHPHNIVGKNTKNGVAVIYKKITANDPTVVFQHIGIQCVKKNESEESLNLREEILVDPFSLKFSHKKNKDKFNLNKVRLAFQVFLQPQPGKSIGVPAIVSRVIMDKKSHGELKIVEMSDNCASVEGGKKILLFSEKVHKDYIMVEFAYTDANGDQKILYGNFNPNNVHKQHGISFTTPAFPNFHITQSVQAQMYLHDKKEDTYSDSVPFYFEPKFVKQEAKPIVVAARNNKRDRATMKENIQYDDTPQQESTGKIVLPPKGFKSTGGSVSVVKNEPLFDLNGFSATEMLNKATPQELRAMNPPNMNSKDFTIFMNNKAKTEKSQISQDDFPIEELNGVDIEQMGNAAEINLGVFDTLSANLSESMKISDNEKRNLAQNVNQDSNLETPDVSMEQSKSKSNLNNLG